MAEWHPSHYHGSLALEDGGQIGVARLADMFAIACECGALTATVSMTRAEVRDMAYRMIDASQMDREEE